MLAAMRQGKSESSLGAPMCGTAHVIVIGPTPPPTHGVSIMISLLVDGLRARRVSLTHIETSDGRSIAHLGKPDVYDAWLFVRQFGKTLLSVVRHRSAVVYLPMSQSTAGMLRDGLFLMIPWMCGRPYVCHLHGGNFRNWLNKAPLLMQAWVRMLLRRVDAVIVLSPSFQSIFADLVDPARVLIVPNGVPVPPKAPAATVQAPDGGGQPEVAYVGLLSAGKGIVTLLAAAARILQSRPKVRFTIAGDWSRAEFKARIERMLSAIEHKGSIRFVGPVAGPEKAEIFRRASVFVFPGLQQEGQPLVLLEALAYGVPIVHTGSGCATETVGPSAGLLVRKNDVEDLAAKICTVLDDEDGRLRMRRAARERFEEFFTLDKHLDKMAAILEKKAPLGQWECDDQRSGRKRRKLG